jgi:hypothetical protein
MVSSSVTEHLAAETSSREELPRADGDSLCKF